MAAFGQKTVVRSYKLRIKDKFKRIETDTDNVVALLQSCVSSVNIYFYFLILLK